MKAPTFLVPAAALITCLLAGCGPSTPPESAARSLIDAWLVDASTPGNGYRPEDFFRRPRHAPELGEVSTWAIDRIEVSPNQRCATVYLRIRHRAPGSFTSWEGNYRAQCNNFHDPGWQIIGVDDTDFLAENEAFLKANP